jgi:hypothetical protein
MTEHAGPEATTSAPDIELTVTEATVAPATAGPTTEDTAAAQAPPDGHTATVPRDAANWAAKVDRLQVGQRDGVRGTNVDGRRLMGPMQGFGKMLQKTYRMDVGAGIEPPEAITVWREHFPEFWPAGSKFAAPLTGIAPGEVALLDVALGGVKLSTGVMVLYSDAESFTLMTPQGHMFAGWITFSAERSDDSTSVQAQGLFRANDPVYELGLMLGGSGKEDRFWVATLEALGRRLGVESPVVTVHASWVDNRRQWRNAGNIWHNSLIRSVLQTVADPTGRRSRRGRGDVAAS